MTNASVTTVAVADSPKDEIPLEHLESEITELAGHINAATCRFLLLVAEFDRRQGWATWGMVSCAAWLSWRCGIAPVAAREHLRVARALGKLVRSPRRSPLGLTQSFLQRTQTVDCKAA